METTERNTTGGVALLRALSEPTRCRGGLLTVIRLLERLGTAKVRIGGDGPFSEERIRFAHESSLFSQPNEISRVRAHPTYDRGTPRDPSDWIYEVVTCVLGMTGTDSPLPLYLVSEFVLDEDAAALQREFLDIFHNRLVALFYRGVAQFSFPWEMRHDASDAVSRRALRFAGVDVEATTRGGANELQRLHVSALFAGGPPTPRSIRNAFASLLRHELDGAPLELREFTGGWVPLDADQCNAIGRRNNCAGDSFVIGTRVRHPGHEARIVVGPIRPTQARLFSPGATAFERVAALVDALSPSPVVFKLELHIRSGAFPPFTLGQRRIGRDACITARRDGKDALTVSVHELPRIGERVAQSA